MSGTEDRFRHVTFLEGGSRDATPMVIARPAERTRRGVATQIALDAESDAYFTDLCHRWGLRANRYRSNMFHRRQAASLRVSRASTPREAMHAIGNDPALSERALATVMIGVTSFFRDPEVFAALRAPLRTLHDQRGPLTAISVGCSNGAELYTLAMIMADAGMLTGARLIGVDCRPGALATAREGIYSVDAASTMDPLARARYARPVEGAGKVAPLLGDRRGKRSVALQLAPSLREACRWELADVFAWPATLPPSADVILCRNLAIYLTDSAAAELWTLLASKLTPGGLLVVGKAERPTPNAGARFARVAPGLYRQRDVG